MRILVTGNQGFIGPVLVGMARARGHTVTGLDVGYFADGVARSEADHQPDRQILRDMRDVRDERDRGDYARPDHRQREFTGGQSG